MLRTFDCAAFFHQNEGKFEPKDKKCVFLSYLDGVKGHRLYDRPKGD